MPVVPAFSACIGIFNRLQKILSACTRHLPKKNGTTTGTCICYRGKIMRFSQIGSIAVMLIVIAVALAGCTGSSPAPSSPTGTQTPVPTASSGSIGTTTAAVGGTDLFGNLNYNWVEYRTSVGSGKDSMTVYTKYNRQTGKCSMRFEGAGAEDLPAGMQEMDCSATGSQAASADPNEIRSDATVDCSLLEEPVIVPAGTFSATKCTITAQGKTSYAWLAKGKFMVKMEASTDEGSMNMVLNAYG